MKNESVKKSLEKSKNVQEKRKIFKRKICIKKDTHVTIIAMNFVQEQLITKLGLKNTRSEVKNVPEEAKQNFCIKTHT